MSVRISAIVCTYNRALFLEKALQSLAGQTLPKEQYEVIVVDNASTDGTREVVKGFEVRGERLEVRGEGSGSHLTPHTSHLRYIHEPVPGLSRARNTGWQAAKGEYVAYLDDDAIANPDWLQKIVEAFESIKPQPGIIGGKVEPVWEAPRPAWLADKLLGQLALVDWGDHPKFLSDEEWIAGANTAFPVTVLEKIGGFKESLGRKGKSLLSMEENLARIEIEKRGYGCYYEPAAVVKHRITAERLTQKWFIDRAYWNGVSGALFNGYIQPPSLPARICKSVSTIARIVFSPREVYCWLVPTSKPDVFAGKCSVYARFGHVAALLKAQTA